MDEKLKQLYDRLVQDGYELPEFSAFSQKMSNKDDAQKLYSVLSNDGYELPSSFDDFYSTINPPSEIGTVKTGWGNSYDPREFIPALGEQAGKFMGAVNRGLSQVVSSPLKLIGAAEETIGGAGYATQAGQAVEDFTEYVNPTDPNFNSTANSVGEGLGQGLGMLASAGTGTVSGLTQTATKVPGLLPSLGKALTSRPAMLGGAMTAVPEWEQAKAAGLDDDQAFKVLIENYLVGQTEAIPISNLLERVNKITGNQLLETVKAQGIGALEEGLQEALQTYLSNEVAKEEYDPNRDPLFQVLESAKVGGIVGFILPGITSLAKNLPAEKRTKLEQKAAELQINDDINQSSTGDPQLDAEIDVAAQIDPVDKQVLEEVKVADAVQEEQKETEKAEKIQEALQKDEQKGTEGTEKAENTKTNTAKEAEIKSSQTPEYKQAVARLEDLQQKFANLPIDANADELLFDLREARQALQKIAGTSKSPKTEIQKQIEDVTGVTKPEKSVKMTPTQAIKQQVQTFYRGVDKGVKKGAELKNDLVSKVQEAMKESPLQPRQVSAILTRIKNTNLYTPGSIYRLNCYIDKVSEDAEYSDKLAEARSINKKLRKLAKSSNSNVQNYKGIAKSFASINPDDTDIDIHLDWGRQILNGLTSPTRENYAPINVAGAEEYITKLQDQPEVEEGEPEVTGDKRNVQLFSTLNNSIEALKEKDLSEFDDSEKRTIETLKSLDPSKLTDKQATDIVRVIDNIVENDDFSNAAAVEPIIKSRQVLEDLKNKYEQIKRAEIKSVGKVGANLYQQFSRIFGNSGIAADVQQKTGILDVFNAGSRVEKQEIKFSLDYKNKVKEVNRKYKTSVQDLDNQVKLTAFANLAKNYGDDSHIAKVKNNIARTAKEYEGVEPDKAQAWREAYDIVKDVKTVDDVIEKFKQYPALYELWQFNKDRFKSDINERLGKTRVELYNKPYVEANNYAHTDMVKTSDTTGEQQEFMEGQAGRSKRVKQQESKTGITATQSLPQGFAYSSDWISSQIKGYRKSLYDIEASRAKALVNQTLYSPDFVEIVGGPNNAKIVRNMVARAEQVQRGASNTAANDAMKMLNAITRDLRTIGATRALASLSQPFKQVPSVWTKALFNHIGTKSLDSFIKGIGAINLIRTSPNLNKLFDQYTISVRGERLGGIERGDAAGFRLKPGAAKKITRVFEQMGGGAENLSRIALKPLTNSDVYAAKTTWLGYYLQKLKEQGVTDVDLNSEYLKQNDPKRQSAAAYAEQMVAETQVPSNPATLAQISRNENDGAWNFVKNTLLPFSTYSLNAKYRLINDVDKLRRNPNTQNAAAVGGDLVEVAAYAGIVYALAAYYKDPLLDLIRNIFGLPDESDEEKDKRNREKAFWGNIVNPLVPISVGQVGEYATSKSVNALAYLIENPDTSYGEWKKETGGFVFEPDAFDAGVYSLGLETISNIYTDAKNLASDTATLDEFGRTKEVDLTEEQKNLLTFQLFLDLLATAGLSEADVFNATKKIMKEQMRASSSEGGDTSRPQPRVTPRPRPRFQPRPSAQLLR